ncbi:MAG: orotidine-5'-phosphate decarboxylase [Gammaproteobacteria bacterium]|nr:orotidine-5'-phosphate decarboxylase [Gammaproteobacteria bacterium]
MTQSEIIVAVDYPTIQKAIELAQSLDPESCRLKVGKELFTRGGPQFIEAVHKLGFDVFLDLKFHDIPNTVAAACRAAADLGVWMINVHALGGRRMMEAAQEAVDNSSHVPKLIAVTILTSHSNGELHEIGLSGSAEENVLRLANLAKNSGLDGVVCSAKEAAKLKQEISSDFILVTPGIRPAWAEKGDQSRVMTPREAISAGSDYLVIGRPITESDDPQSALLKLIDELAE